MLSKHLQSEVNQMILKIFKLKYEKILTIKIFSWKIKKKIGRKSVGETEINAGLITIQMQNKGI